MELFELNKDKYLSYFDKPQKIIVIYEHHRYDISDYDCLNTPQIKHLENRIARFNPVQKSGRVTYLEQLGLSLVYPKPAILGASSFDILRYEKEDDSFVYVLTPTQAACYFIRLEDKNVSKKLLTELVSKHPINLKKMKYQVRTEYNYRERLYEFYDYLNELQEKTIENVLQRGQTHLGKIF